VQFVIRPCRIVRIGGADMHIEEMAGVPSEGVAIPAPGDAVDHFIEEYGDDWTLEMVRFGHDDGGHTLDIMVDEKEADRLRALCPPQYQGKWTVVIGVARGWGADEEARANL
jgi:hypothetical protein